MSYLTTTLAASRGAASCCCTTRTSRRCARCRACSTGSTRQNARDRREGRPPIQIVDYGELVPRRPIAAGGLPELVGALCADAAGSVGHHLR